MITESEFLPGYVMVLGNCVCCSRPFSFNPHKVPSYRVPKEDGTMTPREPICRGCFDAINRHRANMGLPPNVLEPDAYEPIPESEL